MSILTNIAVTAAVCLGFYRMGEGGASAMAGVWVGVFVAYQIVIDVIAGDK